MGHEHIEWKGRDMSDAALETQHPAPAAPEASEAIGPQAWYAEEMLARKGEWHHQWTAAELAEIEGAVQSVMDRGLDLLQITAADFPVPEVAERLKMVEEFVLHGPGFFFLRGLSTDNWTLRQAATAFWGLGAHMGQACSQNGKGHVLGHVKNLGLDYTKASVRGYQTNAQLPYHTDSSDIAALMCWRASKSGGASSVASSSTVYNEIRRRRPDLLAVLMQPFQRTRWGEIPEGKNAYAEVPVFMPMSTQQRSTQSSKQRGDRVIAHYVRSAIRKGQELPGVTPLSDEQIEALDLIDELVADPAIHLDMEFQPGDIQLVCNHNLFHSRTAFEDHPEADRRRHLLRLWLACEDGPDLPDWLLNSYEGKTKNGRPNGIVVPGVELVAPLEA